MGPIGKSGPLVGIRVVEMVAIGPVPFCGMLLADMGAEVLVIDRKNAPLRYSAETPRRGKSAIALDLKDGGDLQTARSAIRRADVLLEGFRPGVMEKLGLGPEEFSEQNPKLVYARMTGWGQSGPLSNRAGHDINFIAVAGALANFGPHDGPPLPPLNLLGDYGGGALFMALGVLAALYERERSGHGQIIDAAMIDGIGLLTAVLTTFRESRVNKVGRGENVFDGSAHFYRTYRCSDDGYISVGALEPQFYGALLEKLGLNVEPGLTQHPDDWAAGSARLSEIFLTKSRDEWTSFFSDGDFCVAPVLQQDEAPHHAHLKARQVFTDAFGVQQPAPAPRFSRTPSNVTSAPPLYDEGGSAMIARWIK